MPSGVEILEAIDRRLAAIRRDTDALDRQFRRAREELAAAQRAELDVFGKLARLRLEKIANGELLKCLDDADRRVAEVLEVRNAAEKALIEKLASAEQALAAAEAARERQRSAVAVAARAAEDAAAQAAAQLDANDDYRSQLRAAQEAHAIAEHAQAKAVAAERDRVVKSEPYDADAVFTYLWRNGYGTPAYQASGLVRMLDRIVARASGYDAMRRNYWLLQELPRRLREHADRMRLEAEDSLSAARGLEARAAAVAEVPALQRTLAEAEDELTRLDRAVDELEETVDTLVEQRAAFAAGDDEHSLRCTRLLAEALERADLHELRKRASRTPGEHDDRLVAELERLDRERSMQQQELIGFRRLHQTHRERTLGLEEVRRRFKARRFDTVHSEFASSELIDAVLDRFAAGAVGVDELWESIARQQRERAAHVPSSAPMR